MRASETKEEWEEWRDSELERARTQLAKYGYVLDAEQLHIGGERFLASGRKLVLTGTYEPDRIPVIIKFSTDKYGRAEIHDERRKREILKQINFSYHTMRFPEERFFEDTPLATLLITTFIPQETIFIQLPLRDQFFFALSALESQEGTHVATLGHERELRSLHGTMRAIDYLRTCDEWCAAIQERMPDNRELCDTLYATRIFLKQHQTTIERYCGFLTHTDFVPHNLRIQGKHIVILDHTSLIIGNKYESWGRFVNFMALYNPELEAMLMDYVRQNRSADEYQCLRAMRAYKIAFLLNHHTRAYQSAEGDLATLIAERVHLWTNILVSVLNDIPVPKALLAHYKARAIQLRSPDEIKRQQEISGWK